MLRIISPKVSVAVLGSGSWATALVKILTDSKVHVNWYVRDPEQAQKTSITSKNPNYLSEVRFKARRISVSSDLNEVVAKSKWLLLAIPSAYLESELKKITQPIDDKIIVSGVKGFIPESQLILGEHLHQHYDLPWEQFIVIGGPSHAEEIALERLSYLTLASRNKENASQLRQFMRTSYLQIKVSNDVIGIEYGATLKNIYALAERKEEHVLQEEELEVPPVMDAIKNLVTEMPETETYDNLFENVSDTPTFVAKEDVSSGLDLEPVEEEKKNINDLFAKTVSIDLNDRISFIKHLFEEDAQAYERVLSQIITFERWEEVEVFLKKMVKPEYQNWKDKEQIEERFISILQKNFSD